MTRKMWLGCLTVLTAAGAVYVLADYAYWNPEARFTQVVAAVYRVGVQMTPLPVVHSAVVHSGVEFTGRAGTSRGCEQSPPTCPGSCPGLPASPVIATASAMPAELPSVFAGQSESEFTSPVGGKVETLGAVVVVPDADTEDIQAAAQESAEPLTAIPPRPAEEPRPPAIMPYIEDEPAAAGDRCFLCECWQRFQCEVIAAVQETRIGAWLFGGDAQAREPQTDVPACDCKKSCPAKPAAKGAAEESEETQRRIQSHLPNSPGKRSPAQVDTMEYRPGDARKGEFDPRSW